MHGLVRVELVMLRADDYGVYPDGAVLARELDGHLRLGVGPEVGHQGRLVVPDVGEHLQQLVGDRQRERHVFVSIDHGISEHHALVARALLFGEAAHDAPVYVGALLVDSGDHSARGGVESVFGLVVAYPAYDAARHGGDVHIGMVRAYFSAHDYEPCGAESLAGYLGFGILAEELIENCI